MKLKKLLALVLCITMVLSTMSFNVFAADTTQTDADPTYVAQVGDEKFVSVLSAITYALENKAPELKLLDDSREVMTSDYDLVIDADLKITADAPVTAAFYNDDTKRDFAVGANGDYTLTVGENVTFDLEDRVIWLGYYDENCTVVVDGTLTCANLWVGTKTVVNSTGKLISDTHEFVMRKDANLVVNGGRVEASYFQLYTGHIEATNGAKIISHGPVNVNGNHKYHTEGDFSLSLDNSTFESDGDFNIVAAESWSDGVEITLANNSRIDTDAAFGTTGEVDISVDKTSSVTDVNGTAVAPLVEVTTYEELVAALAEDKANVVMMNDITGTATKGGYSKAGVVIQPGDVLNGNGKKLTINGANGTWDCAIAMTGGTVKNLTVAKAFRGIFMPGANGDVVIDNCKLDNVCYTFNSDAGSREYGVTIKNTVLNGWTSFSDVHKFVTFENCTFGKGTGGYTYSFCRPYNETTFTGCEFNEGFVFDASETGDNNLAFNECTYDGKDLSAGNGMEMFSYGGKNIKVDGKDANLVKNPVAKIGLTTFAKLEDAFAAAQDGDTITLIGNIEAGTVKLPAAVNNLTIKGAEGATLTNSTIMAADGNSINYDGLTIKNIIFENSRISLTGWRTGGASIKNLVVEGNTFQNIDDTSNSAPLHINLDAKEAVEGFTFTNNVIDGATGGSKSGVYAQVTGNAVITNNVINNVAFRPFVVQITTDDGIADNFVVEGNTFSGSAEGRLQALGNNAEGTDKVNLVVTNNIIHEVPGAQEICYWNFNPETTEADLARNYFGADIFNAPSGIYYNSSAASVEDLIDMGVFPYYTKLNADGTIDEDSLKTVVTDANGDYKLVDEKNVVNEIAVEFELAGKELQKEDEKVYNINLTADGNIINRLNSVDLTFALEQLEGENDFTIIASNDEVVINPVDNSKVRYEFHYDGKTDVATDTSATITIGQVKFTGYGKFSFVVATEDANGNSITTNAAHATKLFDNIVDTFVPGGNIEEGEGKLNIESNIDNAEIKVPVRTLTVNVTFPNEVKDNAATYQNMKVEITGTFNNDVTETREYKLGEGELKMVNGAYVVEEDDLVLNNAYTVTVSGAGYRTARYTVTMTTEKQLNFWNNVMDEAQVVEIGKDTSAVKVTFLAGDIVKDNKINIYDLSAVVSYFGTEDCVNNYPLYAKYDLNRDGVIDSKDVAYVLVSWNN